MAIEGIRGEAREACNRFAKVMTNLCPRRSADAAGREFAAACPLAEVVLVERERRATLMPDAPPECTDRFLTAPRVWGRVHTPIGHLVLRS